MIKQNIRYLLDEISTYNSFDSFKKDCGYLDIETTGLSPTRSDLTIAGIYSRDDPRVYIKGQGIRNSKKDIEDHTYIITFNGNRFDIPFLKQKIGLEKNFKSIDLMYLLREIGLKGGLKKIETALGITRSKLAQGMSGKDAIYLWKNHLNGCNKSLEKLVRYNIEDIVNLEILLNYVYFRSENYPISNNHVNFWKKELYNKLNL